MEKFHQIIQIKIRCSLLGSTNRTSTQEHFPSFGDVGDTTLRELLQTYAKEVSSHLKGSEI